MKHMLTRTTLTLLIGGAAFAGGAGPAPIVTPVKPAPVTAAPQPAPAPAMPKPMMMPACTEGGWAKEAIDLVTAKGLFIGYPDGSFDWCNAITRQEVAQVLARLLAQLPDNQSTFNPAELERLASGHSAGAGGLGRTAGPDGRPGPDHCWPARPDSGAATGPRQHACGGQRGGGSGRSHWPAGRNGPGGS